MDYYVFKSPQDNHAAVARMSERGTVGWPAIYDPATFQQCWDWIRANCTGGQTITRVHSEGRVPRRPR
jgi:hypothetical protein